MTDLIANVVEQGCHVAHMRNREHGVQYLPLSLVYIAVCPQQAGPYLQVHRATSDINTVMQRDSMAKLPCPLEDLGKWCHEQLFWHSLCESCSGEIEVEIARLRRATWDDLGKIFNIPEWKRDTAPSP